MYAGKTRDGKMDVKITTQLGRTDDLVMLYASTPSDELAEHLANIGFVVRAFKSKVG